jgi:hypothetical protein
MDDLKHDDAIEPEWMKDEGVARKRFFYTLWE